MVGWDDEKFSPTAYTVVEFLPLAHLVSQSLAINNSIYYTCVIRQAQY